MRYYADAKGRRLPNESDQLQLPTAGQSIALTIDFDIQMMIERELDQGVATYPQDQALAIV
jgi:stage V sporulation protein D (sporulation-specific penicillin-binding protein)